MEGNYQGDTYFPRYEHLIGTVFRKTGEDRRDGFRFVTCERMHASLEEYRSVEGHREIPLAWHSAAFAGAGTSLFLLFLYGISQCILAGERFPVCSARSARCFLSC